MYQTRRAFLSTSALALVAGVVGRPALLRARAWPQAQPAPPQAPLNPFFGELRRGVGYYTCRGGTIGYLVNAGGIVVVDSEYPDAAKLFLDGLKERSFNRGVDRLINTHHHADHTAGNIVFKGNAKQVVAHKRAAELMRKVAMDAATAAAARAANAPPGTPPPPAPAELLYPDVTFTETWTDTIGDETIRAKFYGPAHTAGDVAITFERANVVHMGDLMFNRRQPVTDRPAGTSLANWIVVVESAEKDHAKDTQYIFGHAGTNIPVTGGRADLFLMRDYLTALLAFVRQEIKSGKTRDEIIANTSVLKGFDQHGPLNKSVLGSAFDELSTS